MKAMRTYGLILLVFSLPLIGSAFTAKPIDQQKQPIDSILDSKIFRIYENPNEAIAFGLSVYEDPTYDLRIKVKALMLVSLGHTSKRNYQKALEYIIKADELSKKLNDKVLQIEILFRTGILYQQLKIFDKSISYLEKTEELALLYPIRADVVKYLANSYIVKGFIYKDNLNCDIALEFFEKGIAEYKNVENEDVSGNLSIAYYNQGNCYTLLSRYTEAKDSYNKAIVLARSLNANSLMAFAKKGLAAVLTEVGEHQKAIDYLMAALEQAKDVGDIVLNSSIYNGLLENHLALNQWDEYQKYYKLYSDTQLEIKVSERNSISDALNETKHREVDQINQLKKQTSNRLKVIIALIAIVIITVFFIYKKNKKTIADLKKAIKTIQNKK